MALIGRIAKAVEMIAKRLLVLAPFASVGVAILLYGYLRHVGLEAYLFPSVSSGAGLAAIAVGTGVGMAAIFITFVAPSLILLSLASQPDTGIPASKLLRATWGTAGLWVGIYVAMVLLPDPWLGPVGAALGSFSVVTLIWFLVVETRRGPGPSWIEPYVRYFAQRWPTPVPWQFRVESTPQASVWAAWGRAALVGFFLTFSLMFASIPLLVVMQAITSVLPGTSAAQGWAFVVAALVILVGLFPALVYLRASARAKDRGEPHDILGMAFFMVASLLLITLIHHRPAQFAVLEALGVFSQAPKTFLVDQDDAGLFRSQGFGVTEQVSENGNYLELHAFVMYELGDIKVICTHNRVSPQAESEVSTCRRVDPKALIELHHFAPADLPISPDTVDVGATPTAGRSP